MSEITAPDHIKELCMKNTPVTMRFNSIYPGWDKKYCRAYQPVCICGCGYFDLYINDCKNALGICRNCLHTAVFYDLSEYPAASAAQGDLSERELRMVDTGEDHGLILVYDYPDEFEFNDDNFDNNDITGFTLLAENKGGFEIIIDDETA